ncbi:ankyrin repeat [Fusarium sp. NRRL 25303]|nr:ankyrin repeat [Fusarium sp. NRRL 25303]
MKMHSVPVLAFSSSCLAQVAANPPDGKHYSPIPLNIMSEYSTSVNVAPYQSNTSLYYLGYKDEDWSRPFVKYWKPAVKQISDEVQKGITESPHASSLGSGHTTNVTGNSYLMHQIRRRDDGQRELRSRFFLDVFGDTQGRDLNVHCAVEMSHLATFLPQLFAEFKDTFKGLIVSTTWRSFVNRHAFTPQLLLLHYFQSAQAAQHLTDMLYLGHHLVAFFTFLSIPALADSGDDFSNNLFSDLAPLLALFGERVTMQFLSQSMGWADCIILAVAPLGIITTIVSAIRVDGPPWLKAIIGRSRENLSAAEMELMSSTSQETCELWNGRDVVRCQGKAPVTEFICLAPVAGSGTIKRIRFMKLSEAIDQKLVRKQHEQRADIFNILVPSKWSRTEPQRFEESNQSPGGGIKYFWDGFRSRRKSRDVEVPTPIFLESRTPEAQAQPPLASELIVLRNTTTHAPNITLNRHHKVDRGHLYMVASFGILLQIGVLVYFGFITYYPTLKFKKNNKRVPGYAFPFAAAGTVLLVLGMLLSAHVVNRSTTEERYEPAQGREIRMIWLQQKQTVSDQVFGSFALYPRRSPQAITTSKRNSTTDFNRRRESESSIDPLFNETSSTSDQSHETQNAASSYDLESVPAFTLTVFATLVCLAGFIIQFIGLRAMHWSAAVGQLIAVMIMTILRAIVRLGFIAPLKYSNLRDRFELDGLALALGDPKLGPDSGPMNDDHNFDFGLSKHRTWTVVLKGDSDIETPDQCDKPNPGELSVERRGNEAQEILEIRRHLAQLAGWGGPASREANSLAEAIEVTMNTLCPWEASEPPTWSWKIQVDTRAKGEDPKTFPVFLHLKHLKGQWKARLDELDSVLSLWLASIDKERELASTTSKTKRLGDNDEWYRKRSSQTRGGLILLGERTKYLEQAFEWWLPADAPKPLEINESEITEQYEEAWRVVGTKFREGYYKSSLTESSDEEEDREQTNVGDFDEVDDEDEESSFDSQTVKPATFFSISSNDSLEHLFARHIFHAFVWAAVSRMKAPIDQRSEMEVAGTVIPGEWNNIRLRGTILARLAGSIRSSGLMDLNQAYLTLIPPLHAYARLGELDCVVETVLGQALQHERLLNWYAAYDSYSALLDLASEFREDSFTFRRTVAIVVEYMRTITLMPKIQRSEKNEFGETEPIREELSLRFSDHAYQQIRNDLEILYNRQQRGSMNSLHNDRQQIEIVSCGFTRLHHLIACPDYNDPRETYNLDTSHVVIGLIPDGLQNYVRTQDILGWTPLHYAAALSDHSVSYWIDSLLFKGAELDATDIRGWTPLHYSMWNFNYDAVSKLLERGANMKLAGVDGMTPLHCAAAKMDKSWVDRLISNHRQRVDQFATDNFGRIPIHLAAQEGHKDVIASLRLSINEKDQQGRTAMHLAALSGHWKIIPHIIEYGANPNEPFQVAGYYQNFGYYHSYTVLHWAVLESNKDLVVELLNSGADVNARCGCRKTPLHYACEGKDLQILEILMSHEADANAANELHITPLRAAASHGRLEYVYRLLKVDNIDIDALPGSNGWGPLASAIMSGYGDVVRVLVESGAAISRHTVDFAASYNRLGKREDEEKALVEVEERVQEEQGTKRPGLKTEDIEMYIRAAFSLRNAFEEHVHGEMGGIILSELTRRLCPP